jgi:ESCRT-I complex subunit VPS28
MFSTFETKLYSNSSEREYYDNLADIYAILVCTEHLEKMYIRDFITVQEYTDVCSRLIAQFKAAMNVLRNPIKEIEELIKEYSLHYPAAINRLLTIGVPATIEHAITKKSEEGGKILPQSIAECVQNFITLMDSLKLNMVAVDQLHPLLSDILTTLNQFSNSKFEESRTKVKTWLIKLNTMRASDELNETDTRQLLFDLETAHHSFYRALSEL